MGLLVAHLSNLLYYYVGIGVHSLGEDVMADSPSKLYLYRKELAKFALVYIPTKNLLIRRVALAILDEFPAADPPPKSPPGTRLVIASLRAVQKIEKSPRNKQRIRLLPITIKVAEMQVHGALAKAHQQLLANRQYKA